ncbi:hypothetical protein B0T22DRAFT_537074 [Podospora appendiculata]|uniref:Uncharacterized protein n=1 Tax=Podospora appendiculata TaxID=314037 RepID=A0AAE0XD22_9PEZI|nr:hypothetical protein B0T22DRAFT_537074 [Podospora appendiculata]
MAQVLVGGPEKRTGKTREQIYKDILSSEVLPTFYNWKRAWGVLGYKISPRSQPREHRPHLDVFIQEMIAQWLFIQRDPRHPETTSRRAAKARAYILDGLRTFGFRSPLWSVNSTDMHVLLDRFRNDGTYGVLPGPRAGRVGTKDTVENTEIYRGFRVIAPAMTTFEPHDRERSQRVMWIRWHRYQGFRVRSPGVAPGQNGANFYFKAIPVPPGPDSLWHSLSYWRSQYRDSLNNSNGASIWKHGNAKARIWTYFMQVLADQTHVRWKDYQRYQHLSRTVHPDFGELSLIRCLHAGRLQSRAAVCYWRSILYVIADYFATQVIVFRWAGEQDEDEGRTASPLVDRRPDDIDLGMQTTWTQGRPAYSYDVYGAPRPDGSVAPILLATSDYENYDPVDYDLAALHLTRGYEGAAVVNPAPPPPFIVPPGLPEHPWWPRPNLNPPAIGNPPIHVLDATGNPPCQLARYNFIPDVQMQFNHPNTWRNDREGLLHRPVAWAVPEPDRPPVRTRISRQIHYRFQAAFDLDGLGFDMPPGDIIEAWRDHRDNFVTPRYGLEEQPWQLRFGPLVDGLNVVGDYTQWLGHPEIEFEDARVFGQVSHRVVS